MKNSENNKLLKGNDGSEGKDKQIEKQQVNVSSEQHNIDAAAASSGVEVAPQQNYFSCSNNNLY